MISINDDDDDNNNNNNINIDINIKYDNAILYYDIKKNIIF